MCFGSGFKKQQNALEGFGKLKHSKSDSTQPIQSHMQVVLNISVLHWCDELLATARARHSVGRAGASSPKQALPSAGGTCPALLSLPCRPHQKPLLSKRCQPCWIMRWLWHKQTSTRKQILDQTRLLLPSSHLFTCSLNRSRHLPNHFTYPLEELKLWSTKPKLVTSYHAINGSM